MRRQEKQILKESLEKGQGNKNIESKSETWRGRTPKS